MPELSYKTLSGFVLLVIALAGGSVYYLEKTNDYASCQGTWNLLETGQYECSKNGNLQWCYNIEYRGSGWYRCYIGKIVKEDKSVIDAEITPISVKSDAYCVNKGGSILIRCKN